MTSKFLKLFWRKKVDLQRVDLWKLKKLQLYMDGFTLVVWKPWLQLDQLCGQKNFLANILKQES